jgi:hypothetical protein
VAIVGGECDRRVVHSCATTIVLRGVLQIITPVCPVISARKVSKCPPPTTTFGPTAGAGSWSSSYSNRLFREKRATELTSYTAGSNSIILFEYTLYKSNSYKSNKYTFIEI